MNKYFKFIVAILLCEGIGVLGAIFTVSSISSWYQALNKPYFSPPNWVFGPVWVILYFLIGISLFLVWENGKKSKAYRQAKILFYTQLGLNFLWPVIFFGMRLPVFAFQEIIVLWVFIIFTFLSFIKISKSSGLLLIPYFLWVSFAALLNLFIIILNPLTV
jgi:translocator protein